MILQYDEIYHICFNFFSCKLNQRNCMTDTYSSGNQTEFPLRRYRGIPEYRQTHADLVGSYGR